MEERKPSHSCTEAAESRNWSEDFQIIEMQFKIDLI